MRKLIYLAAMILTIGVASCEKDGVIGPEGPRGERGERGEQGIPGEDGEDGATVLNGTTNPNAEDGNLGDFYINTSSYLIFGPKTSSGWGNGASILGAEGPKGDRGDRGEKGDKGDKGDKGEAEYVILSGSNNPPVSLGNAGDFYYNTQDKTLFYRTSSSWSLIAKLSNTIQFTKSGAVVGETDLFFEIDLPWDVFEESMVNVYIKPTSISRWYPLPGYVTSGFVENTFFNPVFNRTGNWGSYKTQVRIYRSNGMHNYIDATIRIVVTEAEVFHTVAKHIDFNNFDEVSQFFDLGEF